MCGGREGVGGGLRLVLGGHITLVSHEGRRG